MYPTPTCGRIVHYFHNDNDSVAAANGVDKIPALIIQVFESGLNLSIFPMNRDTTNTLRWTIPHKSDIAKYGGTSTSYWDWPEIVPTLHIAGKSEYPVPNTDGNSGDITFKRFSDDNRA